MNINSHVLIPAVILRKLGASWPEVIAAAIGGMMPDLVSAFEHVMFWMGFIDHKWEWRNWTHFIDQGAWVIPAIILCVGAILWTTYESAKPIYAACAFTFGYLLHVGLDYLWHPAGGGWYFWGAYVDIGFNVLLLVWFLIAWRKSHLTFKSFLRTL